jgi:hypothetical protein
MEALQMLKFRLKKDRLNFTDTWVTAEKQMTEDEPDDHDFLADLLRGDIQDGFDSVMRRIGLDEAD